MSLDDVIKKMENDDEIIAIEKEMLFYLEEISHLEKAIAQASTAYKKIEKDREKIRDLSNQFSALHSEREKED